MLITSVEDYRPSPALDAELASLGAAAIHGWPDQAPVDASLARAMLRPAGQTATTLTLIRAEDGALLAGAAIRWPATLDAAGRLWGPLVRPDARRGGLGRTLMHAVGEVLAVRPGVLISTTEIPESRKEGWGLFEEAGWDSAGMAELHQRALHESDVDSYAATGVRAVTAGEYVAPALAELFAACRPELGPTTARDTFDRWRGDSRYQPVGLLLAEEAGRLVGAAIVYPSRSVDPGEAAEALLADLLVAPDLAPEAARPIRRALVEAGLRAGVKAGSTVARAVVNDPDLAAALAATGFTVVDRMRRYTRRGVRATIPPT